MAKKKTPVGAAILADSAPTGVDEVSNFGDRLARYGQAHSRSRSMLEHLQGAPGTDAKKTAAGLATCGNYLHFREYFTVGKIRLHNATFCKQHLVCPLCAIRRGAKALGAYLARWEAIREQRPDLKPYLLTLTVKNGPDLQERHAHLTGSLRKLMTHRRNFNAGVPRAPWTEMCKAEGGVYTLEQTNIGNGWHPHCHMIVLAASEPSQSAISAEWLRITGDSMIVDCRPITGDPSEGFMEVFKYAVKFSGLSLEDNWHAAQVLKGKRLLNSFGLFRGVEVPDSLLDEPLDSLPYWDRFYRFIQGEYRFTGESPKAKGQGTSDSVQSEDAGPRAYEVTQAADLESAKHLPGGKRPGAKKTQPKSFATLVYEGEQRRKRSRPGT